MHICGLQCLPCFAGCIFAAFALSTPTHNTRASHLCSSSKCIWACSNQHNGTSSLKFKSRERTDNPDRIDEAHDDGRMRLHNTTNNGSTGYVSCRQKKQTSVSRFRFGPCRGSAPARLNTLRPPSTPSDLSLHPTSTLLTRVKPTSAPCRSLASLALPGGLVTRPTVQWAGEGVTSLNE